MNLIDALEVLRSPVPEGAPSLNAFLAVGFTPLHLQTFLAAELRAHHPQRRVMLSTGLFGDLEGNIRRLPPSTVHALLVLIEWGDLDPRLGMRRLGGWRPSNLSDISESAGHAAAHLRQIIVDVSRRVRTVVCMPTLPLPPLFWTPPDEVSPFELHLGQIVATLATSLSEESRIHIANPQLLGEISPPGARFDPTSEVITGFPYSLSHASALARTLAGLVDKRSVKKGLITDLDDTLWGGILGEDGIDGISWDLEHRTHMHGLYQQLAASLAGAGVLIGIASKNDPELVNQVFERRNLLISRSDIFPVEVHWSRKSESVRRIVETWNVGEEAVVFIDDSPMEVAEVKAAFPGMECIVFPKNDYQMIWELLKRLRYFFGKPVLTEDDSLRLRSIRNASAWRDSMTSATGSSDDLLRSAEACITFSLDKDGVDARAFELVNKTNQFNLNGKRWNESEWRNFFTDPSTFLLTAFYEDKYGPLGKIAVLIGKMSDCKVRVYTWVMSCRAFSRRLEYQCLRYLFEDLGADTIVLDYQATLRNGPLRNFLTTLVEAPLGEEEICVSRESYFRNAPPLFHSITSAAHV